MKSVILFLSIVFFGTVIIERFKKAAGIGIDEESVSSSYQLKKHIVLGRSLYSQQNQTGSKS